jgi:hypothetical protein
LRRFALVLALAASACAAHGPRGAHAGPPLKPFADPSAVIAAEIGFNQLAQAQGQWTAFLETAAPDAEMFAPQRVKAAAWLKGRANPAIPVQWQARAVWSSCDGSFAVTHGDWQRPGSIGIYATVWQHQDDGKYKWLLDMSLASEASAPAPEMIAAKVAECKPKASRPPPEAREAGVDLATGYSRDLTLEWQSVVLADGRREFRLRSWNGKDYATVLSLSGAGALE